MTPELQAALNLLDAEYRSFLSFHSKPRRRNQDKSTKQSRLPCENKDSAFWERKNQIPSNYDPTELHNPLSQPGYIPSKEASV